MSSSSAQQPPEIVLCGECGDTPEEGVTFQICSRCKSVAYCSEACQRAAWRLHCPICNEKKKKKKAEAAVQNSGSGSDLAVMGSILAAHTLRPPPPDDPVHNENSLPGAPTNTDLVMMTGLSEAAGRSVVGINWLRQAPQNLGNSAYPAYPTLASIIISCAYAVLVEPYERYCADYNISSRIVPELHPDYEPELQVIRRIGGNMYRRSSKNLKCTTGRLHRLNYAAVCELERTLDGETAALTFQNGDQRQVTVEVEVTVTDSRNCLKKDSAVGSSDQDDLKTELIFFRNALAHASFRGERTEEGKIIFHFWNFHQAAYQYAVVELNEFRSFIHAIARIIQISAVNNMFISPDQEEDEEHNNTDNEST